MPLGAGERQNPDVTPDWIDEVDLDAGHPWLRMGTRALGDAPWLVSDDERDADLAVKADLIRVRRNDVYHSTPAAVSVATELADAVRATGVEVDDGAPPLEAAALAVQEDLCLLRKGDHDWILDSACVCFPSRWRLADKLGRPLVEVHGPTPGYDPGLRSRVTALLDRLERPVRRRNWFVHPDPSLFQPEAPAVEPVVPAPDVDAGLFLRSERQTLSRLPSGWVTFTIRTQQVPLGVAGADPAWAAAFDAYLSDSDPATLAHRGMAPAQVAELRQ